MLQRPHSSIPQDVMLSNKNSGEREAKGGNSSQATVTCLLFSPCLTAEGSERLGGCLAAGRGQLTTNNKFIERNGREDFQRSSSFFLNLPRSGQTLLP